MQLRDTVLVVNQHFIPERRDSPYIYGVVQHALKAADILSAHGARVSFVLYERVDGIGAPKLRCHEILGQFPAVTVSFHFDMEAETLTRAFREAVCTVSGRRSDSSPLVYYQTSAVLPFAPIEFDCVVTHHSPFVLHVADVIGWPLTHKAFEWDHAKVEHLLHVQEEGLAIVRARDRIICAEISPLQVQWLQAEGVPPERIVALAQPLACPLQPASLPAALVELLGTSGLIAVTAVSRLDDFKNVELFVRGSCLALENGDLARAAVIGGFPRDVERERLRALVPSRFVRRFYLSRGSAMQHWRVTCFTTWLVGQCLSARRDSTLCLIRLWKPPAPGCARLSPMSKAWVHGRIFPRGIASVPRRRSWQRA